MTTYISLLRGINVSGQKKIKMAELQTLYVSLGFTDVQTYIQSGNVVFRTKETDASVLEHMIHQEIQNIFCFDIPITIRTKDELTSIYAHTPFVNKDPKSLYVIFLSAVPTTLSLDDINKAKKMSEEFLIIRKEIYLFCPEGYGKSKLTNNFWERKLKVSATTRNRKTVHTLVALAEQK